MDRRFLRWAVPVGGLVLLTLLWWAGGRNPAPNLPSDPDHATANNAACAPCHAPDGPNPLSGEHPPKEDCVYCHRP